MLRTENWNRIETLAQRCACMWFLCPSWKMNASLEKRVCVCVCALSFGADGWEEPTPFTLPLNRSKCSPSKMLLLCVRINFLPTIQRNENAIKCCKMDVLMSLSMKCAVSDVWMCRLVQAATDDKRETMHLPQQNLQQSEKLQEQKITKQSILFSLSFPCIHKHIMSRMAVSCVE